MLIFVIVSVTIVFFPDCFAASAMTNARVINNNTQNYSYWMKLINLIFVSAISSSNARKNCPYLSIKYDKNKGIRAD